MNRVWPTLIILFSFSCGNVGREPAIMASPEEMPRIITDSPAIQSHADTLIEAKPANVPVKLPRGIYRFTYTHDSATIQQTIKFHPNRTYRLEERFRDSDSVSITTGTWSPSNNMIWIYKQQVVRGRYGWKGDTLQYFSPAKKISYPLTQPPEIELNPTWKKRASKGILFFGVGNEPFWSIEIFKPDSLLFRSAEQEFGKLFRVLSTSGQDGKFIYTAGHDSLLMTVSILPYFCNDGMSDYIYPQEVIVEYQQQVLRGCGLIYGKLKSSN